MERWRRGGTAANVYEKSGGIVEAGDLKKFGGIVCWNAVRAWEKLVAINVLNGNHEWMWEIEVGREIAAKRGGCERRDFVRWDNHRRWRVFVAKVDVNSGIG
jgi:hypothetical protein